MLRARRTVIAFSQQPSVAEFMRRILEDAGYDAIACWSTVDDPSESLTKAIHLPLCTKSACLSRLN
jgi:hypothetical protein